MVGATKLRRSAALFAGLSALALSACDQNRDRATPEAPATGVVGTGTATEAAAPGANVDVDAVKEAPSRYYGKTVTVTGEVDEIYNDRAFELEGTGWAFNDNITVLTKTPVRLGDALLARDHELIVTGKVRPFVEADIERDLGWDIGNDITIKLKQRPVIVADSIRMVNEYGRWSAAGTKADDAVHSTLMIIATGDPVTLVGRKVDLGHERVQSVMGKGLWVGPSVMSEVFVLPKTPIKDVKAGDWVRVSGGTVQKAPKDAVKTWELPANMEGMAWDNMLYINDATVTKAPAQGAPGQGSPGQDRR